MSKVKDFNQALSFIAKASHRSLSCTNSKLWLWLLNSSKSNYGTRANSGTNNSIRSLYCSRRTQTNNATVFKYSSNSKANSSPLTESKHIVGCGCKSLSLSFNSILSVTTNNFCTSTSIKDEDGKDSRDHNLIVKGLPLTVTDEEFQLMFSAIGPVKSSTVWRDKTTGSSLGFGFVDFQHDIDAQRAIQTLSGSRVQDKCISVCLSRFRPEQSRGRNLLVRKVPESWTEVDLEKVFEPYGKVVQSRIPLDLQTGASLRLGYVCFDRAEEATRALKTLHGTIPDGATDRIYMKFCDVKKKKQKVDGPEFPKDPSGISLLVKNLPQNLTDKEFRSLFKKVGPVKKSLVVRDKLTGTGYGFGYVSFERKSHAKRAMKTLSGSWVYDKKILVMELAPGDSFTQSEEATKPMTAQGDLGSTQVLDSEATQAFDIDSLESPNERLVDDRCNESSLPEEPVDEDFSNVDFGELTQGVKVIIGNVPTNWGTSNLKKLFEPHRKIVPYRVSRTGFVSYGTHDEARRAVNSLNKKILPGTTEPVAIKFVNHKRGNKEASLSGENTNRSQDIISSEVMVKNLPLTMSDQDFLSLFERFGPIRSAEVQRDKTIGISYGFGFVHFESLKNAEKAIETLYGHQLGKNTLRLTLVNPTQQHNYDDPKKSRGEDLRHAGQSVNQQGHLMIENLPGGWTKENLKQVFGSHGNVIHSSVTKTYAAYIDPGDVEPHSLIKCLNENVSGGGVEPVHIKLAEESQHCEEEDMTKLLVTGLADTLTELELGEILRDIGPLKALPKIERNRESGQSLGYGYVHFEHGADAKRAIKNLSGLMVGRKKIKLYPESSDKVQLQKATLFVSSIPEGWQEADVIEYFEPYGNVMAAEVPFDPATFISKGFAFVRFETRQEAKFAQKCVDRTIPDCGRDALHVRFMRISHDGKKKSSRNFSLLSESPPENTSQYDLSSARLMIKNFPLSLSDKEISYMFQHIGPVSNCYIHCSEKSGKRFDFGFVEFLHPEDARQAIENLHGVILQGKKLTVKFARQKDDNVQEGHNFELEKQEPELSTEEAVISGGSHTMAEVSELSESPHLAAEPGTGESTPLSPVYVSRRERRRITSTSNSDKSSGSRGRSVW